MNLFEKKEPLKRLLPSGWRSQVENLPLLLWKHTSSGVV